MADGTCPQVTVPKLPRQVLPVYVDAAEKPGERRVCTRICQSW